MDAVGMIGLAASISLLSGWRLYLTVFAVGLAMRFGWVPEPARLHGLDVLANWWVIGIAGVGALAEFFADKVMWVDSAWDAVHTLVRPVGGALLALAIVDPKDGAWQVAALLLGGGAALLTHGAKAGTRAAVNVSPEPFSNIAVSSGEDVVTGGLLVLVLAHPAVAGVVALVLIGLAVWAILALRKLVRRLRPKPKPPASA
ncbi:DUF4126 domain-containing protein [Sphingomonas panacisoli]|uniref:DUF4126 domain-containing protein n=1 Tax=Sphingomonas panacisoli TaxID=1813879 RepID=A0A5B8LJN9_9SPHN|nr:DUF4126 domain-containing protein [Sphingomonas panacisoli]QDZ08497.1 DUF4126 domain-containing protein [Sphingomonas panacisoli]